MKRADSVVFITGANRGLGRALAQEEILVNEATRQVKANLSSAQPA